MQPKPNEFHRQTSNTSYSQLYAQLNYHRKISEQSGKTKRILIEEMRPKTKNEKPFIINNYHNYPLKPKKTQTQSHELESEEINEEHLKSNFILTSAIPKIYEYPDNANRTGIFERRKSEKKLGRISIVERGKSLKYWKVDKLEPKLISQIKGFLNNLISDDNGCSCGPDCSYSEALIKWVGVPEEKINDHYERLLSLISNDDDKSSRYEGTQFSNNEKYESENSETFQEKQRSKHLLQIQKDVVRTQAHNKVFKNKLIQDKMERILLCYSIEDPEVGYIQSMNIVMSGILYHVRSENKTYAICRKLFNEIRDIYLHDFKKCYDHIENVIKIMKNYSFDLYTHLIAIGIDLKIVLFPWILSILCAIVPLEHTHRIYLGFISKGWKFVYQSILAMFLYHKDVLMEFSESGDLLVFLSASNPNKDQTDWQDIFDFSNKLKIQSEF